MATFVWLKNNELALNMDHVVMVTHNPDEKMVAVEMATGDTKIFKGDDALRLVVWLRDQASLPVPTPGGQS